VRVCWYDGDGFDVDGRDQVETIMKKFFSLIADAFFVECVSCLAAYGNNNYFKVRVVRVLVL
jgi:hypothetical protein